ncbi:3-oxoacyl-ACP synthase III family protein [Kutzneria buriramensis]|uniref:3-oxoacyl-[acyl-carrier-protein] synthase-3 n=1 Tax=Kutzneria buriramensis TaxID=1045776 RepID=A0A3E0GZ30_9PSEU|nr:ketoacyl-ACP synthase III [Kutzneria buriramensis]REH32568.1 3-oxoacyl-[acyl-carrier-protein] synthase-3 [Kutzneria buriramensis]
MPVGILNTGSYVPDHVVGNAEVARWSGATEDWIRDRTGVFERRYADVGTPTSELAHRAVDDMLSRDPGALAGVGAIVLATSTPDQPQPATAAVLHGRLGLPPMPAFDVNSVCAGFLYALVVGSQLVTDDRGVLVVGADIYSTIMDRGDRRTVTLFGDGAGAVVLGQVPEGHGLHAHRLVTHGEHRGLVEVAAGGTRMALDEPAREKGEHLFRMQGRAVREYAMATLPGLVVETLDEAGLLLSDVDRLVLHQANPRMLADLAHELGVRMDRVVLSAPRFGNTGAASIPITLRTAERQRPFVRGERILFAAVGGGMSAGAAVLTWY